MEKCKVHSCKNKHKGHGYCQKHLTQIKKHGKVVDFDIPLPPKECEICKNKFFMNFNGINYCQRHYWQMSRHGYIFPIMVEDLCDEIWKPINFKNKDGVVWDLHEKYAVSNKARIKIFNYKGTNDERLLKPTKLSSGYYMAQLFDDENNVLKITLHRLVAYHFIENPNNKPLVDHIIPISMGGTNESNNLRWVTQLENVNNELSKENYKKGAKRRGVNQTGKTFSKERANNVRKAVVDLVGVKIVAINVDTNDVMIFNCEKDVMKYFNTTAKFSKVWCDKNKIRKGWKFYFYDTYLNLKGEMKYGE